MWARSSESKILRAGRRLHYWLGGCKVGSWRGRHFPRTWPGTMAACTRAHTTVKHITPRRIKKGTKSGWAHSVLLLLLHDLLSIKMTCGTGFSPDNILYLFISFSLCVCSGVVSKENVSFITRCCKEDLLSCVSSRAFGCIREKRFLLLDTKCW